MKLKITEEQLKFIIENEVSNNNIMEINMKDYEDIIGLEAKLIKILRDCKKNNCDGIKIIGSLNFNRFDNKELLQKFCNKLVEVTGSLTLSNIELPMLSKVGKNLDLYGVSINSLLMLSYVGGDLDLMDSNIESLPMLSKIGGSLNLAYTPIESLPMLSYVGGSLNLSKTPIKSLPMLSEVGDNLDLYKTYLWEKLKETMSKEEIKNKFGVKGELYI